MFPAPGVLASSTYLTFVVNLSGFDLQPLFIALFRQKKESEETIWRGQEPLRLSLPI